MENFYKSIGLKIKKERKQLGMSQEMLAEELGVKRVALSSIERGLRRVTLEEASQIADFFNLSTDILIGKEDDIKVIIERKKRSFNRKMGIRISVPQKKLQKFKEILIYILEKVGSKANVGETVIYKLLYFIDFDFYEKYEEQLIGATYIKNHYGPTPKEFVKIVGEMEGKDLYKIKNKHFSFSQTKYYPLRKPDLSILMANEKETIDFTLNRLSDMNAKQISDYSHEDIPWKTTEYGDVIDYESVFYRTAAYSVRDYGE